MKKISPILYKKQYIGHARYQAPYPENSILLYRHLVRKIGYEIVECDIVFTKDGIPVLHHGVEGIFYKKSESFEININHIFKKELETYSLCLNDNIKITTLEELFCFLFKYNICVMLDLTFQKYTFSHLKMIYSLVCKYRMKERTIWGDANVFKLALINRHLICQVGGSWGRKMLAECVVKSFFCKQLIMSYSYYGGNVETCEKIVRWGHKMGFILKVATVNDPIVAKRFWDIGTDLINTDILINKT